MKQGSASRFNLKNLLIATLASKVLVLLVILAGAWFFPFNAANYNGNFLDRPGEAPSLASHFATWDAQIYLHLARVGYSQGGFDNAFYPLYPALVRIFGWVLGGHFLAAALVLSTLFMLGAMALMFRVAESRWGARAAFWGCLFLLAFPLGFYLGLAYTESLFLFLVLLIVWGSHEGKTWPVVLGAFLAPLCRPTGLLLVVPLAVRIFRKKDKGPYVALGAWTLGACAYFGVMASFTGNPWAGFEAQKWSVGHFSVMNLLHPLDWFLRNFILIHYSFMDLGTSVLDRLYFLGFVAAMVAAWKELSPWERAYCLVLGLVPALSGDLMSYGRYLLALFPLFLYLGKKAGGKEWLVLGAGALAQVFFLLRHALNDFVA